MQWTLWAVKDYYHTGNDLLWKKHMRDQEKPAKWDMGYITRGTLRNPSDPGNAERQQSKIC